MVKYFKFFIFLFFAINGYGQTDLKIGGMTLVAPSDSFPHNPFIELKELNIDWVAVVPYAFTPENKSEVLFGNGHQWWGETPHGAEVTIIKAKENGMKIMLKPQLWMHRTWVGDMRFSSDDKWKEWERGYENYIMTFAEIAERHKVEILCIGTEFKKALVEREFFWRALIKKVRSKYSGLITYCSNWDEFETVKIWDAVDLIGVSAYFPLSEEKTPDVMNLVKKWKPIKKKMAAVSKKFEKQILFTEYGYLSVDGCAGKTWILEKNRRQIPANEKAQCNALEALYTSFCDEPFWAGGFQWKWYLEGTHRKQFREHGYTPQGKKALEVIGKWYGELK